MSSVLQIHYREQRSLRLNKLGFEAYSDYLATERWRDFRKKLKRACAGRCEACVSQENLVAHHRTYETLGQESLEDVRLVCHECHDKIHKLERDGLSLESATDLIVIGHRVATKTRLQCRCLVAQSGVICRHLRSSRTKSQLQRHRIKTTNGGICSVCESEKKYVRKEDRMCQRCHTKKLYVLSRDQRLRRGIIKRKNTQNSIDLQKRFV
jgi:hypothetical protein